MAGHHRLGEGDDTVEFKLKRREGGNVRYYHYVATRYNLKELT